MPTQGTRNVTVADTLQYPTLHQSKLQNAILHSWGEVYVSYTISCCKHEHVLLFQKNDARCRLTQLIMGTHTSVELGYRL